MLLAFLDVIRQMRIHSKELIEANSRNHFGEPPTQSRGTPRFLEYGVPAACCQIWESPRCPERLNARLSLGVLNSLIRFSHHFFSLCRKDLAIGPKARSASAV
jgi:hypothetical protein